ncbi:MAG: hypothetical protein ABL940_10295 [Bacteroidia bacterium]
MIKHINYYLLIILGLVVSTIQAQVNSPISALGVGEPYTNVGFANTATGGSAVNSWQNAANIENPASYATMRYTTFEAGLVSDIHSYTNKAGENYKYSKTGFKHFMLAMPTPKGLGAMIAYMPYSRANYASISNGVDASGDSVEYTNAGKGGINRGTIGLSYKFVDDNTFKLSSGFNINALFGEVLNQQRNQYNIASTKFSALYRNSAYYTGVNGTLGMQVQYLPKPLHTLYMGTSFTLETNAKTATNTELVSYGNKGTTIVYRDTVAIINNVITRSTLPSTFNIGVGYGIKHASELDADKYYASINYSGTAWKTSSFGTTAVPFYNSKTISTAFLYNPQNGRKLKNNLRYGVKLAAQQWYYSKSFNDYSATVSIGMPVPRSVSSINVAYTIGNRALLNTTKDMYHTITVGVLLNDIWFQHTRVD